MPVVSEDHIRALLSAPPVPPQARRLERSQALKREGEALIPGCSQTFSKGPTQFVQGVAPVYLQRGSGCRVWDVDGNEYLDFSMALGAVTLGYGDARVAEAIARQAREGISFTLSHPLELEVARLLAELIPCAEMVRFGKNGSDVTSAAVRVSRAFTGRDLMLCCGYHGWQDWFVGTTTRRRGVPDAVAGLTKAFAYNDLASLEALFASHPGRVAAVIMEPVGLVEPAQGFLEGVREVTRRHGALMIFDEIVTWPRVGLGGAQQRFGVIPDLACVGKGLANGMPSAALAGRRDVMQLFEEVFFSSTFGGETASLAAAKATIEALREPGAIETLWERGRRLRESYNALAEAYGLGQATRCLGLSPRTGVMFNGPDGLAMKTYVQQECLKRGLLFTATHNMCLAHTDEDVDAALRVYRTALELLAAALRERRLGALLEGPVVQPVFRKP
ncbi:MAG: aminotransferase class III-fold pyridoxal phosphate-dependent enzyme [Candidatus Omnitrophica bacterium]|nr:aminotransferase class III-fold pyridoxal phosphate-dependent enzyme [Candidatus Omnitrophota bacterium]